MLGRGGVSVLFGGFVISAGAHFYLGVPMNTSATKSAHSKTRTRSKNQDIRKYDPVVDYDVIYKNRPCGPANLEETIRIIEEHFKLLKCYISLALTEAERWKLRYEAIQEEVFKLDARNLEICRITGLDGLELKKPAEVN